MSLLLPRCFFVPPGRDCPEPMNQLSDISEEISFRCPVWGFILFAMGLVANFFGDRLNRGVDTFEGWGGGVYECFSICLSPFDVESRVCRPARNSAVL